MDKLVCSVAISICNDSEMYDYILPKLYYIPVVFLNLEVTDTECMDPELGSYKLHKYLYVCLFINKVFSVDY